MASEDWGQAFSPGFASTRLCELGRVFAPLWVSGWNENKASPVIFVHLFLQPNHVACGILVPDRDETCSGSLKPEVLTAGTAREILKAGPL